MRAANSVILAKSTPSVTIADSDVDLFMEGVPSDESLDDDHHGISMPRVAPSTSSPNS
jgi:hypothetical protein